MKTLALIAALACAAAPVRAPARDADDDFRIREEIEDAMEQRGIPDRRAHAQETAERPPPTPTPEPGTALTGRLVLVRDRIRVLEERRAAAEENTTPEEIAAIDAELAHLQQEEAELAGAPAAP
ncbi:MAG: hypothetical protein PHN82_09340 [bacterium]|nr:hypothetical protein [bacterium]